MVILSPILKAHSLSFSLATTCVYFLWNNVAIIRTNSLIIDLLITFVLSISFYRVIYKLFLFLCQKNYYLRKQILGKYFLEGLWIGCLSIDGKNEYYYEIVEQNLESISIKGTSFNKDHKYTGSWNIINPNLNIVDSKLTYYYEMDVASSGDITLGYSKSTLFWDKHHFAYKETGFAVDNFSRNKQLYLSVKVNGIKNFDDWIAQDFWREVEKLHIRKI